MKQLYWATRPPPVLHENARSKKMHIATLPECDLISLSTAAVRNSIRWLKCTVCDKAFCLRGTETETTNYISELKVEHETDALASHVTQR